ncbi:N-acetyltransferase [Nitrosomonas sp. JL21]|uniref:GNAT family N-acetyltransferase n=1 Tax=Nitrosomonas sp. JL21 TaxID=153949 RepID=UPI00136E02EE|nr:GNAT family N-acetyltransferase [Nitrosomonas sp.]MBL8498047.1 GNAT family N-acetyltransferase [Nitrosomonas sp.]MXS77640.1 N-acetyltransferase [Nitrosomonas sp. JL21]
MEYELRPARSEDYSYCYRLTKRNMFELFCRHWGSWVPQEFRRRLVYKNVIMVFIDGKRAGYINVIKESLPLYIVNFQLSSLWQNKGIGTNILKYLFVHYPDCCIQLTTFEDNPAKRLYERMGFVIIEKNGMTIKMEKRPHHNVKNAC